jgi:hypothetical protein
MALVICCPCGNPLEFEQLDLVLSLTCPRCRKELELELEDEEIGRRRAVLTVTSGPHWVGEQFLVPVGVELRLGQRGGNWIAFDHDDVADVHCRLRLSPQGELAIEDQASATGTWIGHQRIARGRVSPGQSFRIGPFSLRFSFLSTDGSTLISTAPAYADSSGRLPTMHVVTHAATPVSWITTNRFPLCRWMLLVCAGLLGLYHAFALHAGDAAGGWSRPLVIGAAIALLTICSCRSVRLDQPGLRFVPLVLLVGLAVVDLVWAMPAPAIAYLLLAAGLGMLVIVPPPPAMAVLGASVGATSLLMMAIIALTRVASALA